MGEWAGWVSVQIDSRFGTKSAVRYDDELLNGGTDMCRARRRRSVEQLIVVRSRDPMHRGK